MKCIYKVEQSDGLDSLSTVYYYSSLKKARNAVDLWHSGFNSAMGMDLPAVPSSGELCTHLLACGRYCSVSVGKSSAYYEITLLELI